MLAHHGDKSGALLRALGAVVDRKHAEPRDSGAVGGARGGRRNVILNRAGKHARSAAVAAIDIDRHAITAGGFPFAFGTHTFTTLARAAGAQIS